MQVRRTLNLVLILVLNFCSRSFPSPPVVSESYFFEESAITVQGDFYFFFQKYGGVESLGYPLTQEVVIDGWRVQYFEKGRLEYHPENEPAYRITVGWLGELLHRRRPPIPAATIPGSTETNRQYFPQTGHTLSGDFLSYYKTHGGSVRFGLPISEPFLAAGRITQDFQSARFFWTPRQRSAVTLEEIGKVHLAVRGGS